MGILLQIFFEWFFYTGRCAGIFLRSFWSFWHTFLHSIWHIFWHLFWQSSWYYIWDILTFHLRFNLAFDLAFYVTHCLSFYLAFYLAKILTFYLTFIWHSSGLSIAHGHFNMKPNESCCPFFTTFHSVVRWSTVFFHPWIATAEIESPKQDRKAKSNWYKTISQIVFPFFWWFQSGGFHT